MKKIKDLLVEWICYYFRKFKMACITAIIFTIIFSICYTFSDTFRENNSTKPNVEQNNNAPIIDTVPTSPEDSDIDLDD